MSILESKNLKLYTAWLACAVFYLYQYILRVFPNLMGQEIRSDLSLTAEQFGLLGACTLYAYAIVQIPLGIIIDRVGTRFTVIVSVIMCIVSGYAISITHEIWLIYILRFIIGLGSASAFMSAIKISSDCFAAEKRGLLIGATLSFGTLGVVIFTIPVLNMVSKFGWRESISIISLLGVFILAALYFFVPLVKKSKVIPGFSVVSIFSDLKNTMASIDIWYYAIIGIALYAPCSIVADLWGTDFLIKRFLLSREDAAFCSTMLYLGMALGSVSLSWLGEKFKIANKIISISMVMLVIAFGTLIYGPSLEKYQIASLIVFIGFVGGAEMLCFSEALHYCLPTKSGLTIGFVNSLGISATGLTHYLIGLILDKNWLGNVNLDGTRAYNLEAYHNSFYFVIIFLMISIFLIFIRNLKFVASNRVSS